MCTSSAVGELPTVVGGHNAYVFNDGDNKVYIHGGIGRYASTIPDSKILQWDIKENRWSSLKPRHHLPPALSHHVAFMDSSQSQLCLCGGWDGRYRTGNVWMIDPREVICRSAEISNFPRGAGLSSHAVVRTAANSVLIVGRLGGIRTQRQSSAVLRLLQNDSLRFEYEPIEYAVESRSGHSVTAVSQKTAVVIGGRCESSSASSGISYELLPSFGGQFSFDRQLDFDFASFANKSAAAVNALTVEPKARRYHVAFSDRSTGGVLVHGGESFNAIDRHSISSDLFYLLPNQRWFSIASKGNQAPPSLIGHQAVCVGDKAFLVGGFGYNKKANKTLYTLKFD